MTSEQMTHAISVERSAIQLKRQFDEFVLLKLDQASKPEIINVGDPVQWKKGEYHRVEVKIPDEVRRLAFRQWRKGIALQFNERVRELNRIGMTHGLRLIEFSPVTGEPLA